MLGFALDEVIPRRIFLTKGTGKARERLRAFEMALRDAEIANFNLVRVTSIFPPRCKVVGKKQGLKDLSPGEIVYCVLAEAATNEPNRLVVSSIGLAIPKDRNMHGYLSEHHSFGETEFVAGEYAEDLAAMMLASTLGIPFDTDKSWDERRQIWKLEDRIVRTMNVTQSAVGDKNGQWTYTVSAAILLP